MKQLQLIYFSIFALLTTMVSCIEDGFTTSPSSQPQFSVDTLKLGTLFTAEGSPTFSFKVYNPNNKSISISRIALSDDADNMLRMNVDGIPGNEFNDVEIRQGDSIFVFVEATLPDLNSHQPVDYERHIDFTTNGVTRQVVVTATGIDATRLDGLTVETDTRLTAEKPYIVYNQLAVAPGATLTLDPGTKLHFHGGAELLVDGTLHANGTAEQPIEMIGDRLGNVVGRVDYEIMSGQWEGIYFTPSSRDNRLLYTSVRNTVSGVIVDSVPHNDTTPSLYMLNCQLRNSKEYVLLSSHSSIVAYGCELADASSGVVALQGGTARMANCTIANYYLFTVLGGPSVQFYHAFPEEAIPDTDLPLLAATFDNCIIYGNGYDLSHGDLTGSQIYIRNTLLKSEGENDDNFIDCIWAQDPMYGTVREDYHFDYRLQPESPAIGIASEELIPAELTTDRYGYPRLPGMNLGAYAQPLP